MIEIESGKNPFTYDKIRNVRFKFMIISAQYISFHSNGSMWYHVVRNEKQTDWST